MDKKTALHEILAVEAGLKKTAANIKEEAKETFGKRTEHFSGHVRTYACTAENDPTQAEEAIVERSELVTTVHDKLDYVFQSIAGYVDVMATKDATNQQATADIVVDGVVLAAAVPVTTLLSLEDEIRDWRDVIAGVPTLAPGKEWVPATEVGANIFKMKHPEIKTRTAKQYRNHVKAEATDKFPAQIELYTAEVPIGMYTTDRFSGAITPAQKSDLLAKADQLLRAVKQARQRANATPVTEKKIASVLIDFIMKP
jgi:hypothetical protein